MLENINIMTAERFDIYKKESDDDMRVVKTIKQQIYSGGLMKVGSWGAHGWKAITKETLQFKVNGHHFKGHIRVELDVASDTYKVHLGKYSTKYRGNWVNIETIEGVYCDQLTDIIDEKVEYINAYKDN